MKKFLSTLVLILCIGSLSIQAQKKMPENKMQYFVFNNPHYKLTVSDIVEIAKGMPAMKTGVYKLKNGQIFWCYHPETWVVLMKRILTKVKGSEITNIAEELAKGSIVPWDDNISTTTKNYGVKENGDEVVVDANYKGADSVEALIYMGYPVLKTYKPCINPEDPLIASIPVAEIPIPPVTPVVPTAIPVVAVLPPAKEEVLKLPPPVEEKKDQCCCDYRGMLSVDDVVKLWKAFNEAQQKQAPQQSQGNYMVLSSPQSDDYNWRAQQRQYQPRPSFWDRVNKFFLSVNINGNDRQRYMPYLQDDGGPVWVPPHGGDGGPMWVPGHG